MLSSRYEGYPTVLFEALLLNKPIVATDVSGVREILQDGKFGLIVENSEKGIEAGMRRFLSQPEVPQSYLFALESKTLPFTLKNSVDSLMKIIDEL
jgi:glycosyltransferase involved in cell wall biosynthesis